MLFVIIYCLFLQSGCFLDPRFDSDLEITHEIDSQFYVDEVKDMVNIVQRLIADGKSTGVKKMFLYIYFVTNSCYNKLKKTTLIFRVLVSQHLFCFQLDGRNIVPLHQNKCAAPSISFFTILSRSVSENILTEL